MINKFMSNFVWVAMVMIMIFIIVAVIAAVVIGIGMWLGLWGLVGLALLILVSVFAWAKTADELEK